MGVPSIPRPAGGLAAAAARSVRSVYQDWERFAAGIGRMAELATAGEIIVATDEAGVSGAVVYVGPGRQKDPCFRLGWPVIRRSAGEVWVAC